MASTLSHELNQPLAAITSYATACENFVDARPPRSEPVRQALRGIRTQAERAGQVIRSVQSFLRRRAVDRSGLDLAALIRGLEPLLRLQAARTGARVVVEVPPGTAVLADRIMLEQVLLNLTRNGFEAMAEVPMADRVLQVVARPLGHDERGERVEVAVVDRGRGVPAEVDASWPAGPACLLLDVRMHELSGIETFERLRARKPAMPAPVIFLTGHGDISMAVDAVKNGAFDFFEKPFNDNRLADRVAQALAESQSRLMQADSSGRIRTRLERLTSRERDVMALILEGKLNKIIADELGISMRTVEVHRSNVFSKMGVRSAVELARLLENIKD